MIVSPSAPLRRTCLALASPLGSHVQT
ncbi:CSC1-like protein [Zea mays]|uniref:CSC1-like protein n=1 Tax=Zea mays TaxID=4577 RepID=A0A1D6M4Q8_MAIZE|nr:CSC1-like protein [Zea mays]